MSAWNGAVRELVAPFARGRVRFHRAIWAVVAAICLCVIGFTGWMVRQHYGRAMEDARSRTQSAVQMLEQRLIGTLDSIDRLLTLGANQLGPNLRDGLTRVRAGVLLTQVRQKLPFLESITLLDGATGAALYRFEAVPGGSLAIEKEAFEAFRDSDRTGLYVSGPVGDNIAGWHIGVSRRALDGDGALRHVVVARITLDHFLQMFSTAPLGAHGSVVLFRNDGLLLARSPFDGAVLGRNFSGMQLFTEKLQQAPSGVYEARSISDGQQRMIGYRQVQGFPLTLNATQLMDEVLAPFWLDLKRNLCFAALVAAVILGLGGLLAREGKKRERAERAEREQAILLRNTLDHMDEGLMMVDADKTVQVFNRRALELLELPEELIRSKPTFEAVLQHQRDGDEFAKSDATLRQWVQSSAAGEVYGLYERERPNGTVLEVRTVPLVEGGFVRTYTDVTPRKAAQCAVLQSEERYRVLAENTSDMIVRNSLEGVREYVSPASRALLGYEPEELVGRRPVDLTHPDDVGEVLRLVAKVLGGEAKRESATYRLRHKDGRWVWVEANFQAIRNADGKATGLTSAVRDVTQRRAQAEELRGAKEVAELHLARAEHASRAKGDFLATMSHEIRTPLNAILGFADLLLTNRDQPAAQRRQLELIQGSAAALLTVVNDILDYSKIEAGQLAFDPEPLSLAGLVDGAAAIVRGMAVKKALSLRFEIDPAAPRWVVADGDRLRQVLLNLLNNAIKFTRRGSVVLTLQHLGSGERGERLRFAVTDTGIGIAPDKLDRLFRHFSQVDASIRREFGGTGLGLAISKRLVEMMGGTMGVESEEGRGSTFWFVVALPRAAEPDRSDADATGGAPKLFATARILLAEDLDVNQELARAVLEQAGYVVHAVSDGAEAVKALRCGSYDLVLMDVQMPVMDGIAATEQIRALAGPERHVPIIAMTANVLPEQIRRFKRAGMNDHVGKPFSRDALMAAIERWLPEIAITEGAPPARAELAELLGPQKVAELLAKLERLLKERFTAEPHLAENPAALAAEAHAVVPAAGMLGFAALSALCRSLEEACLSGAPVDDLLRRIRDSRSTTLAEIATARRMKAA